MRRIRGKPPFCLLSEPFWQNIIFGKRKQKPCPRTIHSDDSSENSRKNAQIKQHDSAIPEQFLRRVECRYSRKSVVRRKL